MHAIAIALLFQCFLQSLFLCCEGNVVGKCFQEVEGSRCHGANTWQHDGVCMIDIKGVPGRCVVPDSREFKVGVAVRWRRLKKFPDSKSLTELWMRGSGPGLSWEKSVELKRTASSTDLWRGELSYTSGSVSFRCQSSSQCSMNQGSLEFRLYRDKLAKEGMKGPNFFIPLPLSHSMSGTVDFLMPTTTVYPWFDGDKITVSSYEHIAGESVTGIAGETKLKVSLLYPPSFDHNIRRTYPVVIAFGKREPQLIAPLLEHLFVHEATVDEAFVVVIEYSEKAPFCSFTPFPPGSNTYVCKIGETCNECQSCWDTRRAERCEKEEFIDKTIRCLSRIFCPGKGDEVLDMIEFEMLPEIQERAQNRLLLDFPKNRLSIIGMDGAGLLACYAALTRPLVYANAGCLSAPFNWPMTTIKARAYPTAMRNVLLKIKESITKDPSKQMQYITQKYYVDNGADDNFYFPSVDTHQHSQLFIDWLQENIGLKVHKNIVYVNIPGLSNSYYHQPYHGERILHTIRYPLSFFFPAQGGPSEKFPVVLKIKEEEYAERNKLINPHHEGDEEMIEEGEGGGGGELGLVAKERASWVKNHSFDFCGESDDKSASGRVPVPVLLAFTALSVLVSVAVTVMIMCLRDSNRRAVEEAEKEEAELMEEMGNSDDEDL